MPMERMLTTTRAGEVDFAAKRIIEAHDRAGITGDNHLASLFITFKGMSATLAAAIDFSKAESDLEDMDEIRDESFEGVHGLTLGYTYHLNATISNAAKQIFPILDKYGLSVTKLPYAQESSHVDAMIFQIEEPAVMAVAKNLPGFEPRFAKLKTDELAFGKAFTAWKEQKAGDKSALPASELKKGVIKTLNEDIALHLDAMAKADSAKFSNLAQTVGQIIADNNVVVKNRKKAKAE